MTKQTWILSPVIGLIAVLAVPESLLGADKIEATPQSNMRTAMPTPTKPQSVMPTAMMTATAGPQLTPIVVQAQNPPVIIQQAPMHIIVGPAPAPVITFVQAVSTPAQINMAVLQSPQPQTNLFVQSPGQPMQQHQQFIQAQTGGQGTPVPTVMILHQPGIIGRTLGGIGRLLTPFGDPRLAMNSMAVPQAMLIQGQPQGQFIAAEPPLPPLPNASVQYRQAVAPSPQSGEQGRRIFNRNRRP